MPTVRRTTERASMGRPPSTTWIACATSAATAGPRSRLPTGAGTVILDGRADVQGHRHLLARTGILAVSGTQCLGYPAQSGRHHIITAASLLPGLRWMSRARAAERLRVASRWWCLRAPPLTARCCSQTLVGTTAWCTQCGPAAHARGAPLQASRTTKVCRRAAKARLHCNTRQL